MRPLNKKLCLQTAPASSCRTLCWGVPLRHASSETPAPEPRDLSACSKWDRGTPLFPGGVKTGPARLCASSYTVTQPSRTFQGHYFISLKFRTRFSCSWLKCSFAGLFVPL